MRKQSVLCITILFLIYEVNALLLPNVYTGYTIDMAYGEPLSGPNDYQSALRIPILELTVNKGNIIVINGVTFIVPDQVIAIVDSSIASSSKTNVYTSVSSTQKSLSESYSLSIKGMNSSMFALSLTVDNFKNNSKTYNQYTSSTNSIVTVYKIELIPEKMNFYEYWTNIISLLPIEYNITTKPFFNIFIKEYGTHLITSTLSGGSVYMSTSFSESILSSESMKDINADISLQFSLLTFNGNLSSSEQNELDKLNKKYDSSILVKGGDPTLYESPQEWQKSVNDNPIILKFDIAPLYYFVGKDKRNALKIAIDEYISQSNID